MWECEQLCSSVDVGQLCGQLRDSCVGVWTVVRNYTNEPRVVRIHRKTNMR